MIYKKALFVALFCFLLAGRPVLADDPDLQATLEKMQALLEQQQKQLDEQGKELAAQRLLIKQLQGNNAEAAQEISDTPDVVYPETDSTVATAETQSR